MQFNPIPQFLPKLLGGMLLLGGSLAAFAMEPKVVASIKPVHSLAAGVMQGVGEPRLLVSGGASPHEYSLKPSDTRALSEAQLVFWIGPDLESFLVKPLNNVKDRVRAVALLDAPGMMILPLRKGGAWEPHQHGHAEPDHDQKKESPAEHDHEHAADHDTHIWLDPVNAIAMVRQIVAQLGEADAAHKADYERNGAALIERLNRLNQQLITELAPVKSQPYLVFHDAYQYFERRYDLSAVGSVVLSPEQRPGAKRVADIQARIHDLHARCVFSEPQFQPALVETVIAGSTARRGVLDPLGAELTAGPEAYFQLVQGLSSSLRACLSGA
ncbi:zinc ABC transporter substrate-binding protein, partial [Candidatus Contendibacter odensensis]|uniref:High-affinity zinc uptake system protein ZnuA n=1 Tax=Candidatus Contendobacter odensis Run_B_J11 TaxID=1400861 RepID=A0A7U7J4T3_9GAMM